jgi:hypothetical protein
MKTNEQLLDEITALMATAWLAACERRVIGTTPEGKHVVIDVKQRVCLFGPCRVFIHRAAALDVLRALGTERVAEASMIAAGNGKLPATLNG